MSRLFTDPDKKMEILIRLAFGYTYEEVANAFGYSINTIVNLRKNNYKLYNSFVDHFRIVREVAELGLPPLAERVVNIIKVFYKEKFKIVDDYNFILKGEKITLTHLIPIANKIIALDNIPPLGDKNIIKNYYAEEEKLKKKRKNNDKCKSTKCRNA